MPKFCNDGSNFRVIEISVSMRAISELSRANVIDRWIVALCVRIRNSHLSTVRHRVPNDVIRILWRTERSVGKCFRVFIVSSASIASNIIGNFSIFHPHPFDEVPRSLPQTCLYFTSIFTRHTMPFGATQKRRHQYIGSEAEK